MKRIRFLKGVDAIAGPVLSAVVRSIVRLDITTQTTPSSLLVVRPGGIGDAVLFLPVIYALFERFPGSRIDNLAEKRNAAVFALSKYPLSMYHYDKPEELVRVLRNNYEAVIDTEQWHRLSAVIARLTRAPMLVGYATNERKKLFTHTVPYSHDDCEIDSFFHLIEPIADKVSVDLDKPFLTVPEELTRNAVALLKTISKRRIIAIFPGGSIRERQWGSDRFHLTAKALVDRGFSVIVVGGAADRRSGKEIINGLRGGLDLCGRLSLVETAAVLKESALLITGDSGIMHIGFGLGIKTLSLFGPGIEKKWAPRGPGHVVINKNLPCSPCTKFGYTPKCKVDAECMKQISVDEVLEKTLKMLEG